MNPKVAKSLLVLLAFAVIVIAVQPIAAVETAKAPVALEEIFAPPATSSAPALANDKDQLFVPQAFGCTNQFCTSTLHCQQICGDPWVACVSQLGTKRCVYL